MANAHRIGKLTTITPTRRPTDADLKRFLAERTPSFAGRTDEEVDAAARAAIAQIGEEEFLRGVESARAALRREAKGRHAKRQAQ